AALAANQETRLRIARLENGNWQPVAGSTVVPSSQFVVAEISRLGTYGITVAAAQVASVVVTLQPATLDVGGTARATAEVRDDAGQVMSGASLTWTST